MAATIEQKTQEILLVPTRDTSSRYYFTPLYTDSNNITLIDLFVKSDLSINNSSPTYHTVSSSERNRLDKIAVRYYGNSKYWWLIAEANDLIDPFIVIPGSVLFIPNIRTFSEGVIL